MEDNLICESWKITSREEWLARRGKDVPASLAANLFEGALPYADAGVARVIAHLRGLPGPARTEQMRAGIIGEGMFPEAVAMERPEWRLVKATTYHRIPSLRLGATPDFWIFGEDGLRIGLLQAKTCSERTWDRWQGRPPLGYTIQTHIELTVTGEQYGVLAVIVRSDTLPLYLFEVRRHAGAESKILAAVASFWRAYDAGEFPAAAPSEEIAADLDDGSHLDLSGDNRLPEWLERREALMHEIREADRSKKGIEYEIKNRLGNASTAWLPGWQLSFRTEHREGYTVEPSDPRILRVKRAQETDDE